MLEGEAELARQGSFTESPRSVSAQLLGLVGFLRTTALWLLWFGLVATWGTTLYHEAAEGHVSSLLLAAATLVLWFVLFFAEGIELAVTDLLDKQPEQLHDASTRDVLSEIQSRARFFIAQRQVFVVAIIAFTSLAITYDSIVVPFVGTVTEPTVRFLFTFLLTTFTVLWFLQVTPKQLAVMNSELFLNQSKAVWLLIKLVGSLGVPSPSDGVLSLLEQHSGYGRRRQLLPSRAAYYNVSTHRYGVAMDMLRTQILIGPHGQTMIRKRLMVVFLSGRYGVIAGSLRSPSRFVSTPTLRFLSLNLVTVPERFEYIAEELDRLFNQRQFSSSSISGNLIENWHANVDIQVHPTFGTNGETAEWVIDCERLPERFWEHGGWPSGPDKRLVALLYEVEGRVESAPLIENPSWAEPFPLPCRSYEIVVETDNADYGISLERCIVALNDSDAHLYDESEAITTAALYSHDNSLVVESPLQGATYTVTWRHFKRVAS